MLFLHTLGAEIGKIIHSDDFEYQIIEKNKIHNEIIVKKMISKSFSQNIFTFHSFKVIKL